MRCLQILLLSVGLVSAPAFGQDRAPVVVVGNVASPGVFALAGEFSHATVREAITRAHGSLGSPGETVYIYRPDETGRRREIAVQMKDAQGKDTPDVALLPGDIVFVPSAKKSK
jgi:protein involved in polysaccharide export with SLBB domain